MSMPNMATNQDPFAHLLFHCGDFRPNEKVAIVSNPSTRHIGDGIYQLAKSQSQFVEHVTIPEAAIHGQEPPAEVATLMSNSQLIFGLTKMSMAHTKARLQASERGARYLSLPQYNDHVLQSRALRADFRAITAQADELAAKLTNSSRVEVHTRKGTKLFLKTEGRVANRAPGWCFEPGSLASPPDAEVNIAVVEDYSHGIVVVDGSIPCQEMGLLDSPITLTVENGSVTKIEGKQAELLTRIFDRLNNPKTRVIAEFGIGLNPEAVLCGEMLEDEGCLGTIHLGIGSNATIGGKNSVPFHLDHMVREASLYFDRELIMKDGKFVV